MVALTTVMKTVGAVRVADAAVRRCTVTAVAGVVWVTATVEVATANRGMKRGAGVLVMSEVEGATVGVTEAGVGAHAGGTGGVAVGGVAVAMVVGGVAAAAAGMAMGVAEVLEEATAYAVGA